jgi:hypothetical protein
VALPTTYAREAGDASVVQVHGDAGIRSLYQGTLGLSQNTHVLSASIVRKKLSLTTINIAPARLLQECNPKML